MSDLSVEDDYQFNSVNRADQNKPNCFEYSTHGYKQDQSSHTFYENSFRNSWTSSSLSTASSSPVSGRTMNSRFSHQMPSSSSFSNYSTATPPSVPPIAAVVTSATPSSSSSYRADTRRRQSRTNDGVHARPNSIVSIYGSDLINNENTSKRTLRKEGNHIQKSLSTLSPQNEMESTDSFDRIYSLLTHLITDAATAVDREVGDVEDISEHVMAPTVIPLAYPESDSSDADDTKSDSEIENSPVKLRDPVDLERDDRTWDRSLFRSRSRVFNERTLTKRRSLFLELQSCEPQQGNQDDDDDDDDEADNHSVVAESQDTEQEGIMADITIVHEEPSPKGTLSELDNAPPWTPFMRSAGESTAQSLDLPNVLDFFDDSLHPPPIKAPRRCASFPSMKSEMIEMQHAGTLQQVIQHMDSELDRTVETINGLTRDLVAIATHQNWMQTNYERSNQFQTLQYGRLGKAYSPRKASADYFKQLCQAESPTSPTSHWNRHPSSFWDRDNEITSDASTLPAENPYPLFINPNIPKSTISTDDTISGSEFGLGSPTSPGILSSDRSFSKYFDSLQSDNALYEELEGRKLGLIHASEDEGVMNSFREYRGESFHQNPSQRNSGSSYTFADSSCRTSALSMDGTLISPLDTCSDYKDDRTAYSPPPQFPGMDYTLLPEKPFSINSPSGSSGFNLRRRIRRLVMPASWPSVTLDSITPDHFAKDFTKEKESESSASDQGNCADDEHIPHEDAAVVFSLIDAHISLALLVYWTAAFVVATVFIHPVLAESSSRRIRECMIDVHNLISVDPTHDGENQEEIDPIEDAMQFLKKSESALDFSPRVKGTSLSRSSSVSGSTYGTRSRRKLYHQRRQRDWLVGSNSTTQNVMLYRGSPVLKTMKFFSTSESEPKFELISGAESSATLVDLAN
ncbi:hypothetical protein BGZ76_011270 [Entomortierella beljakovae]|nr:hypothetical protein BGZ76_011270 [Entomortierella beljakovae]